MFKIRRACSAVYRGARLVLAFVDNVIAVANVLIART